MPIFPMTDVWFYKQKSSTVQYFSFYIIYPVSCFMLSVSASNSSIATKGTKTTLVKQLNIYI